MNQIYIYSFVTFLQKYLLFFLYFQISQNYLRNFFHSRDESKKAQEKFFYFLFSVFISYFVPTSLLYKA